MHPSRIHLQQLFLLSPQHCFHLHALSDPVSQSLFRSYLHELYRLQQSLRLCKYRFLSKNGLTVSGDLL